MVKIVYLQVARPPGFSSPPLSFIHLVVINHPLNRRIQKVYFPDRSQRSLVYINADLLQFDAHGTHLYSIFLRFR